MRRKCVLLLTLMLSALPLVAQANDSPDQPLGDVAKKNEADKKDKDKAPANKAKHVFTDDDMSLRKNPIPSIALQGAENTADILSAIHEFRAHHNAEETENVVHDWFDEQNQALSAAIDANTRQQKYNVMRMEAAQDRNVYPNYYNYDPDSVTKNNERLTTERWSQRVESRTMQENFQVISRVQQALMKVRVDVICQPYKIKSAGYDWFKIRTADGVGSY